MRNSKDKERYAFRPLPPRPKGRGFTGLPVSKPKIIKLGKYERIVAAVPGICAGPGWSNQPTNVIIEDSQSGKWRREYIQPNERTRDLHVLFPIAAAVHGRLIDAIPVKEAKN